MTKTINIALGLALVLGACGKKDKDAGGGDKGGGKAADKAGDKGGAPASADVDASKANAAIPASYKGKLEFAGMKLGDREPVTAAAPKGWSKGFMDGSLEPPKGNNDFGFGTSFRVGSTCEGECKTRSEAEWVSAVDGTLFANATKDSEVVKDDKGTGHRMLIVHNKSNGIEKTQILYASWKDGADRVMTCQVDLPDQEKDTVPAFEQACLTVAPAK